MKDSFFEKFFLVGGTSLSLQLGHRISIDLDLFSNETFDENKLAEYLKQTYLFDLDYIEKETVKGVINGVKIDCIAHKYPWLNDSLTIDGIRLAGFNDIAAMKLNAIVGNGTRIKDFIDIAYLSNKITFNQMLLAYKMKYNNNPVIILKAITYFDEVNFNEPIKMLDNQSYNWKRITKRLQNMIKFPDKVF